MLAECKTTTVWLQSVMLKLQEYAKGQNKTEQNRTDVIVTSPFSNPFPKSLWSLSGW